MADSYSLCISSYQPLLLEGLLRSFAADSQATVVGVATSDAQTEDLVHQKKPSLLLLDCAREEHRLDCINRMKTTAPDTRIVVLTGSQNVDHAVRALEAGVSGYLTTRATGGEIVNGVKRVLQGERLVCSSLAMSVMNRIKELASNRSASHDHMLTYREKEVAELLVVGRTNKEIAGLLGISERTVKHYMSCLMQKFATRNRTELVLALPVAQTVAARRSAMGMS